MNYKEFLMTKMEIAKDSGFEVTEGQINKALMPHQRDAVMWALRGGADAHYLNRSDSERRYRNWNSANWHPTTKAAKL